MTGVFRVLLTMRVDPDRGAEFERAWTEVAGVVGREPANLAQELYREPGAVYHVVTDWTDEESFRRFETSEAHRGHRARLDPFRRAVRMTTMRLVHRSPTGRDA
ncbi:antibiotic biosynthesis monooxygenase family protein [Micromonospora sp. NPDC048170]|uniref:antibiotic biosynthesis monooxygenase family protein n=1 Tax=Micromonospora sp. NPDC048170 TaxID=3154819 RepID=UPI0033F9A63C